MIIYMKINQKKRRKLYPNKKKMESYIRHYLKSSGKIRRCQNLPSISMSKKLGNGSEFQKLLPENTNNTPISRIYTQSYGEQTLLDDTTYHQGSRMLAEAENKLKFKNGNISTFKMGLPRKSLIISCSKTILEDKRVKITDSQAGGAVRFPNNRSANTPEFDNFEIITGNKGIIDKNQLNTVITGSSNAKSNANENIQPVCMSITKSIINNRVNCYSKKGKLLINQNNPTIDDSKEGESSHNNEQNNDSRSNNEQITKFIPNSRNKQYKKKCLDKIKHKLISSQPTVDILTCLHGNTVDEEMNQKWMEFIKTHIEKVREEMK